MPDPEDLNPDHYAGWKWRNKQAFIFDQALSAKTRHVVLCLPTGIGKSLLSTVLGECGSATPADRFRILTATKALQDQYVRDFPWLFDFRGRANYKCIDRDAKPVWWRHEWTCQDGQETATCGMLEIRTCCHQLKLIEAQKSPAIVTNYAAAFAYGLEQDPTTLILDEAHDAIDLICDANSGKIYESDFASVFDGEGFPGYSVPGPWIAWCRDHLNRLEGIVPMMAPGLARRRASRLYYAAQKGAALELDNAVLIQDSDGGGDYCQLYPIWPTGLLQTEAKRVYWVSATITPKAMDILGVPAKDRTVIGASSPFPVDTRRVWVVRSGVRVDSKMGAGDFVALVDTVDQIIRPRVTRWKGIIHTTSYFYAERIMEKSDFRERMILPKQGHVAEAVARFRALPEESGAVLISPAVGTGWDFAGESARYQIITKVPMPDTRGTLNRARQDRDREYSGMVAMLKIVQQSGRATRTEGDWSETFIIDDHFGNWFWRANQRLAPRYFGESLKFTDTVPLPQ